MVIKKKIRKTATKVIFLEWMKCCNMMSVYDQLLQNHFNFITIYALL
jgi:hypothetical protein